MILLARKVRHIQQQWPYGSSSILLFAVDALVVLPEKIHGRKKEGGPLP